MRVVLAAFLASVALTGCITELLGSETVTTRSVTCAAASMGPLTIHMHVETPGLHRHAANAWAAEILNITGRDEVGYEVSDWTASDLDAWYAGLAVLGDGVTLHLAWLTNLPDNRSHELVGPGAVAISQAAVANNLTASTGVLFHALGHTLGLVNQGTPLSDVNGTRREAPAGHEPGGVMDVRWHHAPFPATETDRYSEALRQDLQHIREVCP